VPDNWKVETSQPAVSNARRPYHSSVCFSLIVHAPLSTPQRASTWKWGSACSRKQVSPRLPRKEVIQPHLPVRLPCYDFTPITDPTLDACLPLARVSPAASGVADFRGVTGGVYKTRERIHRDVLTHGY
jgi:hypothetical protein